MNGRYRTRELETYPSGLCRFMAWGILSMALELVQYGHAKRRCQLARSRASWSWTIEQASPQLTVVNEQFSKGSLIEVGAEKAATYLHVDDGVFFSDGGSGEPLADLLMEHRKPSSAWVSRSWIAGGPRTAKELWGSTG